MSQLRDIISGAGAIDSAAADVISSAVGGSPTFWKTRQEKYEEALARAVASVSDDDANVWFDHIPAPDAKPKGRVNAGNRSSELEKRLAFFGVSTLGSWHARYGRDRRETRFRTSFAYTSHEGATSMWLRQGEVEASLRETREWNPDRLRERLNEIRSLSRISKPTRFLKLLTALLAEAGVALVVVRAPSGCRASGASRLIAPDKAMVLVSFRYRKDDHFWFTLFHELGHLLLHGATPFVDDEETNQKDDPCEREANDFAQSMIVPENRIAELESLRPDEDTIRRFAVSLGVSTGLILGQLQHRGLVPHGKLEKLRRTWTWDQIEAAA
ncbi:ImmA/IrrE family metallo-endopeptidase [Sphingomonas oryzagri]|uniref:ImmA/IrrE family metallo-endopeptidase n=1 Tax=Sphingomonas oryzagri TaxID=3042314 RepID=A0ABT6N7S1_9SPHN|nr:ImmA/IrrE family metallo-endopeptidase [Sphingomonas oryzagri]MDH7641130.1 ImmA/IrrE family metallo-endopeptidase [Sphingomonas oryzagri]